MTCHTTCLSDQHLGNSVCLYIQEYEENPCLLYSTAHPRGVVQPYSTERIPLVLQAKTVGQLQLTALIAILGQQDPPLVRHMCVCVHTCTVWDRDPSRET